MLTAGALQYADTTWFKGAEGSQTGAIKVTDGSAVPATSTPKNVMTWANASDTLTRAGTHAVISSGISTAVNGGSFGDNLGSALVGEASTIAMATGFNFVGDRTIKFDNGSVPKIFAHAIMGGLLAEATGSDFKTGAMAAGLNEAMSNELAAIARGNDNVHVMLSQLTGLVAAAAVGGDLAKGAEVAQSGTLYNQQLHRDAESRLKKGIATLHAQGQFLDLQPEEVMTDLQRIVDGERDPRKLNPATVAFLNQFPPGVLREALFEPTVTEDRIGIAIDLFFPSASPVGKGKVVVKIANTFGKDALVAVEKKFGEALAGQGAKGLLNTQLSKDIKAYLTDIQDLTGRKFTPQQLEILKADLRESTYARLSKEVVELNRIEFERKLPRLRKEWEKNTGQSWPKENYIDKNGNAKVRNYDAHHVVENKFGGKAEWWNITPAMRGVEHQGGIHRAEGPAEKLFGR
ncbi:DUF637 domain-containing protein [Pseudomonas sp. SBB6]|uniref:DUF637 domain-containing protein n=1 Tax=Pseudomonas sp. SBB6 TaxID=2962032 RepID=UPI0020B6650D|nr:DUF637 domain-containing protein [Pseudomonas sp. SBB6]MCP3749534.1 DUF637 domain-containing protein [Pseudomonas sp. SBB6]